MSYDPLELIQLKNLKELNRYLRSLVRQKLWLRIIIGMVLGLGLGILFGPDMEIISRSTAETVSEWVALPGYFFLAVIQMIVVPLVFASVIRGITSSEDMSQLKSLGSKLLIYFFLTIVMSIFLGLIIGYTVKPGDYIEKSSVPGYEQMTFEQPDATEEAFDLKELPGAIISLLPQNPLGAMVETQMLQVVIVSFIVGIALISLAPKQSKPLFDLLGSIQAVCMAIVEWLMKIAPLAVFGLVAQLIMKTGADVLIGMGVYAATVIGGMFVLMVAYMIIVLLIGRRNPFKFLGAVREALLLAFSTNSSAVVMPLSIKTAEEKLKVRPSIAQFVVPIGATVNMGGSALYQGLATIFMAQVYDINLSTGALIALIITVVGASIGTPATPGVGIVVLSTVLTSAGIPLEGVAIILGVDRVLEMFRTTLNVTGDLTGCVVMERFVDSDKSYAEEMQHQEKLEEKREELGTDMLTPEAA